MDRNLLLACHTCKNVVRGPRYGTGPTASPKLAIVGMNPPADPQRGLHGAWMLHYGSAFDPARGAHEKLVLELIVDRLHLTPQDVYATQAVKCVTAFNETPSPLTANTCMTKWLVPELREVNPQVLIAFGLTAAMSSFEYAWSRWGRVDTVYYAVAGRGDAQVQTVQRQGRFLRVPHPSVVTRFLDREAWLSAVEVSYSHAIQGPLSCTP